MPWSHFGLGGGRQGENWFSHGSALADAHIEPIWNPYAPFARPCFFHT